MTPSEKKKAASIARVMRVARKRQGIFQAQLSEKIGVSQATLSKFEAALVLPSAWTWFELCQITKIPPESIVNGLIDRKLSMDPGKAHNLKTPGVHKRFLHTADITMRTVRPWILFAEKTVGEERCERILEAMGFDPDLRIDFDVFLSSQFILEFLCELSKVGIDPEDSVQEVLSKFTCSPENLGAMYQTFLRTKSSDELFSKFSEFKGRWVLPSAKTGVPAVKDVFGFCSLVSKGKLRGIDLETEASAIRALKYYQDGFVFHLLSKFHPETTQLRLIKEVSEEADAALPDSPEKKAA